MSSADDLKAPRAGATPNSVEHVIKLVLDPDVLAKEIVDALYAHAERLPEFQHTMPESFGTPRPKQAVTQFMFKLRRELERLAWDHTASEE